MNAHNFLDLAEIELDRAKSQHPNWPSNQALQVLIVAEEVGEACKDGLENGTGLAQELVQVAAMAQRIYNNLPWADEALEFREDVKSTLASCPPLCYSDVPNNLVRLTYWLGRVGESIQTAAMLTPSRQNVAHIRTNLVNLAITAYHTYTLL